MTQEVTTPFNRSKGRRMLLLLVAVFALPIVLVTGMYLMDWRPSGGSHGQLVQPPQPLQLTDLHDAQGRLLPVARWKDKWHLVYIDTSGCNAECIAQLQLLRNIHASLHKEIMRVERVLLLPQQTSSTTLLELQQRFPDLVIVVGTDAEVFAGQFTASNKAGTGGVYLIDPLGNLMMRYPSDYEAKGLRRDLSRLLRYSWVG